jgi:hypothetical protein
VTVLAFLGYRVPPVRTIWLPDGGKPNVTTEQFKVVVEFSIRQHNAAMVQFRSRAGSG